MAHNRPNDWGHPNYNNQSYYTSNYGSSNFEGSQQAGSLQNNGNMPSMSPPQPYAHYGSPPHYPSAVNGYPHSEQYDQTFNQVPTNYTVGVPLGPTGNQNAAQRTPRTPGNAPRESLSANYRVQAPEFFAPGVVFRALWSEPAGQVSGITSNRFTPTIYDGQLAYHSIRRFAVIKQKSNYALCVPITTYGGQGTTKVGIDRNVHAIIHTSVPCLLPGELPLSKRPIKLAAAQEALQSASRVNFGKIYTVECNQKVALSGSVDNSDMARFKRYANATLVDSDFEGQ